jgi:hypothetical protein
VGPRVPRAAAALAEFRNLPFDTTLGRIDLLGSLPPVGDFDRVRESRLGASSQTAGAGVPAATPPYPRPATFTRLSRASPPRGRAAASTVSSARAWTTCARSASPAAASPCRCLSRACWNSPSKRA